jgi:hypothetical protein
MQRRTFETALGEVTLSGPAAAFEGSEPLVLLLRGAFATEHQYARLPERLPEARVLFGDTHGDFAPKTPTPSVGLYCAAYSEAIGRFPGPKVICGVSLGGVVALGVKCPGLLGVLALDPPMRPDEAPELTAALARRPVGADADFLWNIFGVKPAGIEARDYFPVLQRLTRRAIVMAGDKGMPGRLAGVVSDDSLRRLSEHPLISAGRVSGVGHDISRGASELVLKALRALLSEARTPQAGQHAV